MTTQHHNFSVRTAKNWLASDQSNDRAALALTFRALDHIAAHGDWTGLAYMAASPSHGARIRLIAEATCNLTFSKQSAAALKKATEQGRSLPPYVIEGARRGMNGSAELIALASLVQAGNIGLHHPAVTEHVLSAYLDTKAKAAAEAKAARDKAKAEAKAKDEANRIAKVASEAKAKREVEAAKLLQTQRKAAEAKAKAEAEAERHAKAEAKAREAVIKARDNEKRVKAEAEAEAARLAKLRAEQEAEKKAKAEAEARAKADKAEAKAKVDEEAKENLIVVFMALSVTDQMLVLARLNAIHSAACETVTAIAA